MPTPIYDAVSLVRAAIYAALDPLTTVPIYWLQAEEGTEPPFVIIQSQDSGGLDTKHLNDIGWDGLMTIKAIASNPTAAAVLMNTIVAGMESLSAVGYSISAEHIRPLVLGPDDSGRWTSAHQWHVYLEAA